MINPALTLSHAEKRARNASKRATTLSFLASGECYTTLSVISDLLQVSEQTALPLLKKLIGEKILIAEANALPFSRLKLYGITAHGIALTESAHPQCREFRTGTTNPSHLMHHLEGQRVRIVAERAGWTGWLPGKMLLVENERRLKKLPDALAIRPDGRRVAVEIERFVKSRQRMAGIMGAHLAQIIAGHYDLVYYFTSHQAALQRVLAGVEYVIVDGAKVTLAEPHRARFKNFDISAGGIN